MSEAHRAEWLPLNSSDMSQVNAIADRIHPGLPERPEVFMEKQSISSGTCFKFVKDQTLLGYGIAHPWVLYQVPPLDEFIGKLPLNADCMYIHDVALLPEARGGGGAAKFVEIMRRESAHLGLSQLACVSVYGTDRLWGSLGFHTIDTSALREKIKGYGDDAKYMIAKA